MCVSCHLEGSDGNIKIKARNKGYELSHTNNALLARSKSKTPLWVSTYDKFIFQTSLHCKLTQMNTILIRIYQLCPQNITIIKADNDILPQSFILAGIEYSPVLFFYLS